MQQSCLHLTRCAHRTVALIQTLCNEEADPNTLGRFPGMRANTGGESLSHVCSSTLCALASRHDGNSTALPCIRLQVQFNPCSPAGNPRFSREIQLHALDTASHFTQFLGERGALRR